MECYIVILILIHVSAYLFILCQCGVNVRFYILLGRSVWQLGIVPYKQITCYYIIKTKYQLLRVRHRSFKPGDIIESFYSFLFWEEQKPPCDRGNGQRVSSKHKAFGWWLNACFHPVSRLCQSPPQTGKGLSLQALYQQIETVICMVPCSRRSLEETAAEVKVGLALKRLYKARLGNAHTVELGNTAALLWNSSLSVLLFFFRGGLGLH